MKRSEKIIRVNRTYLSSNKLNTIEYAESQNKKERNDIICTIQYVPNPRATGSVTPHASNVLPPIMAANIPVKTTREAAIDISPPNNFAMTMAKAVVTFLGIVDIRKKHECVAPPKPIARTKAAVPNKLPTLPTTIPVKTVGRLVANNPFRLYMAIENEITAGPNKLKIRSPAPAVSGWRDPHLYSFKTSRNVDPVARPVKYKATNVKPVLVKIGWRNFVMAGGNRAPHTKAVIVVSPKNMVCTGVRYVYSARVVPILIAALAIVPFTKNDNIASENAFGFVGSVTATAATSSGVVAADGVIDVVVSSSAVVATAAAAFDVTIAPWNLRRPRTVYVVVKSVKKNPRTTTPSTFATFCFVGEKERGKKKTRRRRKQFRHINNKDQSIYIIQDTGRCRIIRDGTVVIASSGTERI